MTSTPTRPVDNVVITTKGLPDRNIPLIDGTTVENKGKLIVIHYFNISNLIINYLLLLFHNIKIFHTCQIVRSNRAKFENKEPLSCSGKPGAMIQRR